MTAGRVTTPRLDTESRRVVPPARDPARRACTNGDSYARGRMEYAGALSVDDDRGAGALGGASAPLRLHRVVRERE